MTDRKKRLGMCAAILLALCMTGVSALADTLYSNQVSVNAHPPIKEEEASSESTVSPEISTAPEASVAPEVSVTPAPAAVPDPMSSISIAVEKRVDMQGTEPTHGDAVTLNAAVYGAEGIRYTLQWECSLKGGE